MKFLLLNESVLEVRDDKFTKAISSIQNETNNSKIWKVCDFLLSAVMVKLDINTTYNNLSVLAPDKIVFTPNDQFQKGKSSTVEMSIGRFISKIIQLNKDNSTLIKLNWTEKDLEEFINSFKKVLEFDSIINNIRVVNGQDIPKYYNIDKYYDKTRGSLARSCMARSPKSFFDIYAQNDDNIFMAIIQMPDDKILSRALIWRTYNVKKKEWYWYLDRVYYTYQHEEDIIKKWFRKNYQNTIIGGWSFLEDCIVPLKKCKYEKFPYLDSFQYLYTKRGLFKNIPYPYNYSECFLSPFQNQIKSNLLIRLFKVFRLQDTGGAYINIR